MSEGLFKNAEFNPPAPMSPKLATSKLSGCREDIICRFCIANCETFLEDMTPPERFLRSSPAAFRIACPLEVSRENQSDAHSEYVELTIVPTR